MDRENLKKLTLQSIETNLAMFRLNLRNHEERTINFRRGIFLIAKGKMYLKDGGLETAQNLFERAIEELPSEKLPFLCLAETYNRMADNSEDYDLKGQCYIESLKNLYHAKENGADVSAKIERLEKILGW